MSLSQASLRPWSPDVVESDRASAGGTLWRSIRRVLEPRAGVSAPDQLRQGRLIAGLSLANAVNSVAGMFATGFASSAKLALIGPPVLAAGAMLSVVAFGVTRSGRLHAGAVLLVLVSLFTSVGVQVPIVSDMQAESLPGVWWVLTIAAASVLLSSRWTIATVVIAVGVNLAMRSYAPPAAATSLGYAALFCGFIGAILALFSRHRDLVEEDRGAVLRARNAELETLRATLEEKVVERTVELEDANETLRRNQKSLVLTEKMASLGRLTAGIAHEMNSPIAAVRAALASARGLVHEYADSIGDPDVTDDDHRAIADELRGLTELADAAAERAAGFVRSMKAQTRDEEAVAIVYDMELATRDAMRLLQHAVVDAGVTLRFDPPTEELRVNGRPGRFQQVVTNLVQNAIDASAGRKGVVVVALRAVENDIELVVSDCGPGIPADVRARIFDPLFTTKPIGKGTGLGLTIVHDIVHGELAGEIDVRSEPTGAVFTVRIPRDSRS
jgi:C4-dicarboxylate-specific signal transduction histidine kinase